MPIRNLFVLAFRLSRLGALSLLCGLGWAQEPLTLEPGKAIEREIAGGQTHVYQIKLAAGQFLHVVGEQKSIDVSLALVGLDGKPLIESELNGIMGAYEALSFEVKAAGDYKLVVRANGAARPRGAYQVLMELKASATEQDRKRLAAEQLLHDVRRLFGQRRSAGPQLDEKLEQALALWREMDDRYWTVFTLGMMATVDNAAGRYEQAVERYEQALALWQGKEMPTAKAIVLNNLGNEYSALGRPERAIEFREQALQVYREIKDRAGEGRALNSLAISYSSMSRYEKALELGEQAVAISREMKDRAGERDALFWLGVYYRQLSRYEKGLEYLEQARAINRELSNGRDDDYGLHELGIMYLSMGQPEKALESHERALRNSREAKRRGEEGISLTFLGGYYYALGRYDKALECYEQALPIFREVKARGREGGVLNSLGMVYRMLNRPQEAIGYHLQALPITRETKTATIEAHVLQNLMRAWNVLKEPGPAIFFGKQSVNVYQEIRNNIRALDQDSQQSFVKDKEETYRTLADLLIAQGRLPEAEQVIRMLKEEEYFEFIRRDQGNAPKADKAQLTPEEQAMEKRYREIADQLATLGAERGTLLVTQKRTPEEEQRLAKLEADLLVAGSAFQKFLDQLSKELGNNKEAGGKVYQLRESQGLMEDLRELGKGVVALYTLVGEDKYRIILTTADLQKGFEYTIKAADLNRKVLEFREALQNPKLDPLPLAQELYRILLGPAEKDLRAARAETLMWSLDGVLRYVPMAALHDGKQYLVERYRNVVFTSASQARLKDAPSKQWRALGLGVTKAHGPHIPALPGVLDEMRGIIHEDTDTTAARGVLPGTIKLDEQFTQEAMLAGLRQRPPVVHVASHFQFQPGNETNSALLLGDGSFLSLAQIKSLPNVFGGVELLTLSACNTATGGAANGKEVEGFGVLAQRQGAKAVVASLWPVADRSTKLLMQEFYKLREASAGTTKAEALRQAQLKLLRGELAVTADTLASRQIVHEEDKTENRPRFTPDPKRPYAHPYYWAPFILIGNWK